MRKLRHWFHRWWWDEDGPTAVEYAFLAFLILVVCIAAVVSLGNSTNSVYQSNVNRIEGASGP
jgi:Flp pilus assembly pilin Flp